jgi:hypothetical protein
VRFNHRATKLTPTETGLLSITAAFRAAGDLKKILGSGFEMIRIVNACQCGFFGFMIKKRQFGDQIDDDNRGSLRCHLEAFS